MMCFYCLRLLRGVIAGDCCVQLYYNRFETTLLRPECKEAREHRTLGDVLTTVLLHIEHLEMF